MDDDCDDEESVSASEFDIGFNSDEEESDEELTQEERDERMWHKDLEYANADKMWEEMLNEGKC